MKARTPYGAGSNPPSRRVLLSVVFGLFLVMVMGMRVLSPHPNSQENQDTPLALRGPNSPELKKYRQTLEAENRLHAYTYAQSFVRDVLLSGAVAHFPDISYPALEITRLQPHRFRVRSLVTWRDDGGKVRQRRFETDLQHGPTDSKWRLVDTEFLDAPLAASTPKLRHLSR